MAPMNHLLSIQAVKAFGWAVAKKVPIQTDLIQRRPGVKWYRNFELGHKLTNRKLDNVDRGRSRIGNVTVWKQHFNLLEETIDKLELRDNPKAIFNCDKSIIAMDKRSGTVVSKKTKYTYPESKGTWDHITINACVLV